MLFLLRTDEISKLKGLRSLVVRSTTMDTFEVQMVELLVPYLERSLGRCCDSVKTKLFWEKHFLVQFLGQRNK